MDNGLVVLVYAPRRMSRVAGIMRHLMALHSFRKIVVVVNGTAISPELARQVLPFHPDLGVVQHDNVGQEFGGYQAGIDSMQRDIPQRLLVMNDTAGSHGAITRTYVAAFARHFYEMDHSTLGTIDSSPMALKLRGLRSSRWIRTHFFAIDRLALSSLGNHIYEPEVDKLIVPSADSDAFFGSAVTGALRERIQQYLFFPSLDSWYGAAPLSAANCVAMAGKARAILQEKYFSMRVEAADVPMCQVHFRRAERAGDFGEKLLFRLTERLQQLRAA